MISIIENIGEEKMNKIEKAEYKMWERCGRPMLCWRCGELITFWQRLFSFNYEHCIVGDSHKHCGGIQK